MAVLLVPDRLVCVFQKLLICSDFYAQVSLGFTENDPIESNIQWMPCWSSTKTAHYNQVMQNIISKCTMLKQMGYNSLTGSNSWQQKIGNSEYNSFAKTFSGPMSLNLKYSDGKWECGENSRNTWIPLPTWVFPLTTTIPLCYFQKDYHFRE